MDPKEDAVEEVVDRGDEIIEETKPDDPDAGTKELAEAIGLGEEETPIEEVVEDKEPMLPKSRYDSVARQNRELEARIAELEQAGKQKEADVAREEQTKSMETHIAELDVQYAEAVKEGDTDAMAQLRAQQREAEREMYRMEMQETGESSAAQAREQVRLDLTIDAIEENYEQLNPEADGYDQKLVDEIQELRAGFEATGRYSPTQALIKAVKTLVPDPVSEVEDPTSKTTSTKDLRKKVDAANKQPPDINDVGEQGNAAGKDTEDPSALDLSAEDFESLPESTLKRMRGDNF